MPFLLPNQQHQSTEGKKNCMNNCRLIWVLITTSFSHFSANCLSYSFLCCQTKIKSNPSVFGKTAFEVLWSLLLLIMNLLLGVDIHVLFQQVLNMKVQRQ